MNRVILIPVLALLAAPAGAQCTIDHLTSATPSALADRGTVGSSSR